MTVANAPASHPLGINLPPSSTGLTVPAMCGEQGQRIVFNTLMTMRQFKNQMPVSTVVPKKELKEQRIFKQEHSDDISEYMLSVDDYILPPLVVTLDADVDWTPAYEGAPFGWLTISPDVQRQITDGMHRGDAVHNAVAADEEEKIVEDSLGVWIAVEPSRVKRRNMFSDINATQKGMPRSLTVFFDSRDPYAIAAKRLTEGTDAHELLVDKVEEERTRVPRGSGKMLTMSGLHDGLTAFAPKLTDEDDIVVQGKKLLNIIKKALPKLDVSGNMEIEKLKQEEPVLASTTTFRVIARAVRRALDNGHSVDEVTTALSKVSWDPTDKTWIDAGYTSAKHRTPSSRAQEIKAAVIALTALIGPEK